MRLVRLLAVVAAATFGLATAACSNGMYAKPQVTGAVGFGEYDTRPSDAPKAQPEAPLPPPPPATAPQEVKDAHATLVKEDAATKAAGPSDLERLAQATLMEIAENQKLSEAERAKFQADVSSALAEFKAAGPKPLPPPPVGGGVPDWLLWGAGSLVALFTGGNAVQGRRLRAALKAYQLSKYEGVVNGVKVTLSEGEMVAAAAAALSKVPTSAAPAIGVTTVGETPDLPV